MGWEGTWLHSTVVRWFGWLTQLLISQVWEIGSRSFRKLLFKIISFLNISSTSSISCCIYRFFMLFNCHSLSDFGVIIPLSSIIWVSVERVKSDVEIIVFIPSSWFFTISVYFAQNSHAFLLELAIKHMFCCCCTKIWIYLLSFQGLLEWFLLKNCFNVSGYLETFQSMIVVGPGIWIRVDQFTWELKEGAKRGTAMSKGEYKIRVCSTFSLPCFVFSYQTLSAAYRTSTSSWRFGPNMSALRCWQVLECPSN